MPGELDGLTQPALALSAPSVAGVEGDGLLTMEEILSLKLDADWVVLSACNTGAGAGAGAEAASGLGRAFFYAGTRAILVTNWSVHSQSARELVTDLFKRQADDAKLSRGEALRQAMMALVDGKGFTDDKGKTEFAYAHPLFWAPYTHHRRRRLRDHNKSFRAEDRGDAGHPVRPPARLPRRSHRQSSHDDRRLQSLHAQGVS